MIRCTMGAVAVYVSKQRDLGRLLAGRSSMPPPLFTLTADSDDELTQGERDRAVELGAHVISARKAGKIERATASGETQPS